MKIKKTLPELFFCQLGLDPLTKIPGSAHVVSNLIVSVLLGIVSARRYLLCIQTHFWRVEKILVQKCFLRYSKQITRQSVFWAIRIRINNFKYNSGSFFHEACHKGVFKCKVANGSIFFTNFGFNNVLVNRLRNWMQQASQVILERQIETACS